MSQFIFKTCTVDRVHTLFQLLPGKTVTVMFWWSTGLSMASQHEYRPLSSMLAFVMGKKWVEFGRVDVVLSNTLVPLWVHHKMVRLIVGEHDKVTVSPSRRNTDENCLTSFIVELISKVWTNKSK